MCLQSLSPCLMMLFATTFLAGCEKPIEIQPTYSTRDSYRDQIEYDKLPEKTRFLYDALVDKSLPGAKAADYEQQLDAAQQIIDRRDRIFYLFQLCGFPQSFKEVEEEGVPYMIVKVRKSDRIIYAAEIGAPEY